MALLPIHLKASRIGAFDLGLYQYGFGLEKVQRALSFSVGLLFMANYAPGILGLHQKPFYVFFGQHMYAKHVALHFPTTSYSEMEAIYANLEGRYQFTKIATNIWHGLTDFQVLFALREFLVSSMSLAVLSL